MHTGITEDHSAALPFQAQVRRPDPTIWWPEGQWNTMTVPTEVPLPRRTWRVPRGGGHTRVHAPREEKRRDGVRTPSWRAEGGQEPRQPRDTPEKVPQPRPLGVAAIRPVAQRQTQSGSPQ